MPVLIVSADPAADAAASVRAFLAQVSLTGRVHYLTGLDPPSARRLWHAYGAIPASAGRAAFDNFASVFLIDPSGNERVVFGVATADPRRAAHDIGSSRPADTLPCR